MSLPPESKNLAPKIDYHWSQTKANVSQAYNREEIMRFARSGSYKLVSVAPNNPDALNNRIFSRDWVVNDHWMTPNVKLQDECLKNGYILATHDIIEPAMADIVLFYDIPAEKMPLTLCEGSGKHPKKVLLLYETPMRKPYWFDKRNHAHFDAVITYNRHLVDGERYFPFSLPVGQPTEELPDLPFAERKTALLLQTNYYRGIFNSPRPWNILTQFRDWKAQGLKWTFAEYFRNAKASNTALRRIIARTGETRHPGLLDVAGNNWNGLAHGWFRRFFPDRPYSNWIGPYQGNKLALMGQYRFCIATENYISDEYYISEKLIDAFHAKTVPVYFGDSHAAALFGADALIDGRQYGSMDSLLNELKEMPEARWLAMRQAGESALKSQAYRSLSPDGFAESVLKVFNHLCPHQPKQS